MIGIRKVDLSPGPGGSPVPPWREAPQLQCPDHHIWSATLPSSFFRIKHQKCNFFGIFLSRFKCKGGKQKLEIKEDIMFPEAAMLIHQKRHTAIVQRIGPKQTTTKVCKQGEKAMSQCPTQMNDINCPPFTKKGKPF